jgi:competence protein ComEC
MKHTKKLLLLISVFLSAFSLAFAYSTDLTIHFIDVGQGDSILIQTPAQHLLIDGGERSAGPTVVNYLRGQGVKALDLVISTHPHSDHIGGLIDVLKAFPVKEVIDPAIIHTTKTFEEYLTLIEQKNIIFTEGRAGLSRELGDGIFMALLHPYKPSDAHLNDASVVTRLEYNQVSLLFTGDAEIISEREMISRGADLRSTILKVGHHGSSSSTSPAFLDAVNPVAAVIMVGAENKYNHPHTEIINRLQKTGVDVYRTDLNGTIIVQTDGVTYKIKTKRNHHAETRPGQLVGSVKSDKYHYPSCRNAETIRPENLIWFSSVAEAKNAGYKPCGACQPPSQ